MNIFLLNLNLYFLFLCLCLFLLFKYGFMAARVLLINGSPRENGNTRLSVDVIANKLNEYDIETSAINIGKNAIQGCIACGMCAKLGRCTFKDKLYEEVYEILKNGIDGFVLASPVYYGGPNGSVCALMDRICYSLNRYMQFKPAASVAVCRRGGATATFDRLNKYFMILNMPIVSSQYWNIVYGQSPGQAFLDEEGMQTMRTLATNMAWMIGRLDVRKHGHPDLEAPVRTNFIR